MRWIVCLMFLMTTVGVGCGGAPVESAATARPLVLDVERGTFRGLRVGDSIRELRQRFGTARCSDRVGPLGEDYYEIGGPFTSDYRNPAYDDQPAANCFVQYHRLGLGADRRDGTWLIVTTHPRSVTDRGVGVGHSVDAVKQRYPRARCRPYQDNGDGDSAPGVCAVSFGKPPGFEALPPLVLSFGMDAAGREVRSIWLNVTTPGQLKRMRRKR